MEKETINTSSEVQFKRTNEELQREIKNWMARKETFRTSFIEVLVVFDLYVSADGHLA